MTGLLFIESLAEELISLGQGAPQDFVGCSEEEVRKIQLSQGIDWLPSVYRNFLLVMGQRAGLLWRGSDAFFEDIPTLKESAKRLMYLNQVGAQLDNDVFVFLMHQGYQFMYFHTATREEDPPVFHYTEDTHDIPEGVPIKKWDHLSEFLTMTIADLKGHSEQQAFLRRFNLSSSQANSSKPQE